MNALAAAVINFNTRDHLRACLRSISKENPAEIVVVDNGSFDGSQQMMKAEFPSVTILENQHNIGYGAAANQALKLVDSPFLLLLNSDTCLAPGSVSALCSFLNRNPRVAAAGPRLIGASDFLQPSCFPFPSPFDIFLDTTHLGQLVRFIPLLKNIYLRTWSHDFERKVPWVSGAAVALRRQAVDQVNGFDERYFMYYEETDLCFRLKQAGWETWFTPTAEVLHLGGISTQSARTTMLVQFYTSLEIFYRLHYPRLYHRLLIGLVSSIARGRFARDSYFLLRSKNEQERKRLIDSRKAWELILRGAWRSKENIAEVIKEPVR